MIQENRPTTISDSGEEIVGPNKTIYLSWEEIQPEKKMGSYEFGFRNVTKMLLFIQKGEFTREDYLYFHELPVARMEDEDYEMYRIRRKFCNALQKYKLAVQNMLMANAMQKFIKQQQEKNELEKKEKLTKEILENPIEDEDKPKLEI